MTRSICRHHMDISLSLVCHYDAFYSSSRYGSFAVLLAVTMTQFYSSSPYANFILPCPMDYICALEQAWSHSATAV
ncbi:hypothetical protein T11_3883 [Trichinella zimbabwensis]|uniref:Uncharacterized protein n=1 Tax=Trichinella zimbabwensis TaxID=268475 RepID=A0A0V1GS29_9BILA|nr:hypothetical protein T11_3883 [Trichinella zimbabwensis]